MKDHTVPVSNQTTLAGARPLLCPHHPHLHGCQEGIINPATSTFRLVHGGATLLFDEDPGGRPVYLLVVVLCCVARTPDVNVIYVRRQALPLMALCPSSARRCAPCARSIDPSPATHATTPSDDP